MTAIKRDGHPRQCTALAAAPSAPNANPWGRCRNVVGALAWSVGVRACWCHGGPSLRAVTADALAERVTR